MRKSMRRVIGITLVLGMLLGLLPVSSVLAQTTTVLVNPPSQSADVNQLVTVEIKVDSVTNLWGFDISLTFDATKLEAQDADANLANGVQVSPGNFLDPAKGFMAITDHVNNTTGSVRYAFSLLAPATPVSGTGVLISITFRAKAEGNALITLDNVTLSNNLAEPIAKSLINGSITVLSTGAPTATPTSTPIGAPTATPTPIPYPGVGFPYVVQWGDTLYGIARRFGVTVNAIVAANGLADPNRIYVGQILTIPSTAPGPAPATYVVQIGDNLFRIGLKFGVPWQAIAAANFIMPPWNIWVGQRLTIPTGGPPGPGPGGTYVVQAGDTITAIAARFGVTTWSIIILNNLPNPNLIYVGQVLLMP
jgi:LysM repeat protein